jgi:hypothetical protein
MGMEGWTPATRVATAISPLRHRTRSALVQILTSDDTKPDARRQTGLPEVLRFMIAREGRMKKAARRRPLKDRELARASA